MKSFLIGLQKYRIFAAAYRTGHVLFSKKWLLGTNILISGSMSIVGDGLQQKYEIFSKHQKDWSKVRTLHIGIAGAVIAPMVHYWYIILDHFIPRRCFKSLLKKVLIDQIIFSPLNIAAFLITIGVLEGMSSTHLLEDFKEKGTDLLKAEWIIWPPAQMLNFFFLPTRFRVLYDNVISLGFDYYYSYIKYRDTRTKL